MPIDFPTVKYADPTTFPPASPASTDAVMARTSGGADKSFVLGNLAGLAPLVVTADQSAYYNGSVWAAYTVTSVGRTLLAQTTQALQRTALGLGDAAVQNIGTSGANVPLLNGINMWEALNTFTSTLTQSGSAGSVAFGPIGGTSPGLVFRRINAGSTYRSEFRSGIGSMQLGSNAAAGDVSPTVFLNIAPAALNCSADNTMSCGTASLRFTQFFAVNTTVSSSDARFKTEPRQLRQAEVAAFAQIARLPAIWRWLSRVNGDGCEPEGREARKHGGPTVQAAMAIMEAHGLAPMEYACFCYDQWEAQPEQWHEWAEELTEDGEVIREAGRELVQEAVEAGDRYSFRKEELLCLIVAAMAAQHDALEARVVALEAGRNP